jgi:molybdopterin-guanine dinucleotide biosynthesis protein A
MIDHSLVILAGGRGLRLGGVDKAELQFQGQSLLARHTAWAAGMGFADVLISGGKGLPDVEANQGPFAGMVTALRAVKTVYALFLPVDALHPHGIEQLAGKAAVVVSEQGIEPLCCCLPAAWADRLQAAYDAGERSPQRWLSQQSLGTILCLGGVWSLNTPEDLSRWQVALPC